MSCSEPRPPATAEAQAPPTAPPQRRPSLNRQRASSAPANACGVAVLPYAFIVAAPNAHLYPEPRSAGEPLATVPLGSVLPVVRAAGTWYLVRVLGSDAAQQGYVACADVALRAPLSAPETVTAAAPAPSEQSPPAAPLDPPERPHSAPPLATVEATTKPATTAMPPTSAKVETHAGYVEWLRPDHLVADGQRIRWNDQTRLKLGRIPAVSHIPLGYEIKVNGKRADDGSLLAQQLDVKPNGIAAYENEVRQGSDELEAAWMRSGAMFHVAQDGTRSDVGRILETGPEVDRVRRIVGRLLPAYVAPNRLRVRVIQTNAWNASAMQNGALWTNRGLLNDVSDDELACVLGHEIAHYTHEHSRRSTRNAMLVQLAAQVTEAALERVDSPAKHAGLTVGATLALSAWNNGYSRDLEDQADRVGLRYAYEGGFDVSRAPRMWQRVLEREGQMDRVSAFFLGRHSRPEDRIRNLEREIRLNYQPATTR